MDTAASPGVSARKGRRIYRLCSLCNQSIDVTDNPKGGLKKHQYAAHPERREVVDASFRKMRAAMPSAKAKTAQTPETATPAVPKSSGDQEGYTAEQVMTELRREELEQEERQEEGGNGVGPDGNGHHEIDTGDVDNIYLRTAAHPTQRTRAMIPKMERAGNFGEAQIAAIVPKTIVMNPMLIQIFMGIAINEWGWDPKMPPGQFVDEALKWLCWHCGYEITPWRRLTPQEMGITEGG